VEACLSAGDLPGTLTTFRAVGEQVMNYPRVPAVFAAVVKYSMQTKQVPLALELYGEVKNLFICSKATYNTLLDALVCSGDVQRASDLFRDMTLKNVMPDLLSYSTLIRGHCTRGDLEHGLMLLGQMQRRGIAPDAVLFNSILDGCVHKQMRVLSEQVLRDMESAGVAPSNFTLSILIRLYSRCGDLEAAFRVLNVYPAKYGFQVSTQVWTGVISACFANEEPTKALDVYTRMSTEGCQADGRTYQTLISGCLRHKDLSSAARLLREAIRTGFAATLDVEVLETVLLLAARSSSRREEEVEVGQQKVSSELFLASELLLELEGAGLRVSDRTTAAVVGRGVTEHTPMSDDASQMLRCRRVSAVC